MVSSSNNIQRLKSSMRFSSVAPGTVTGRHVHELTNMDLAMKLHYIKGVYFFNKDAVEGITIFDIKKPMVVQLLGLYFVINGRIRRSEKGRPFIMSNDAGVRIVEAICDETIDEWLAMAAEEEDDPSFDCLAYKQALGDRDLEFSPMVFIQFTWFKCGGMSVGLSWANVAGDAFAASAFINLWGKTMAADPVLHKSLHIPDSAKSNEHPISVVPNCKQTPNAFKRVDSVGDLWVTPNNKKMKTHTFHVAEEKINQFLSHQTSNVSAFEVLSALVWKIMSKIKGNPEQTRMVTLCTSKSHKRDFEFPSNGMMWSTVQADLLVAEAEVSELVELILSKREDENAKIEEMNAENAREKSLDFIAYGARLTFVDLEEIGIYELRLKGRRPIYVNYSIDGVGDEGVVLVLPGPKCAGKEGDGVYGDRSVTVVLPENQLTQLKLELKRCWNIA